MMGESKWKNPVKDITNRKERQTLIKLPVKKDMAVKEVDKRVFKGALLRGLKRIHREGDA